MKTYKKIGSCKKQHSVNVVARHITSYLNDICDDRTQLNEMIAERLQDAMTDGQAACEAVGCEAQD